MSRSGKQRFMRTWNHPQPGPAAGHGHRIRARHGIIETALLADWEHVARCQRSPAKRAHVAQDAGRPAPEHRRHRDTAAHRQRRSCAGAPLAEPNRGPLRDPEGARVVHGMAADENGELGAGNRAQQIAVCHELRSYERDLDRRGIFGVADELIGQPV